MFNFIFYKLFETQNSEITIILATLFFQFCILFLSLKEKRLGDHFLLMKIISTHNAEKLNKTNIMSSLL